MQVEKTDNNRSLTLAQAEFCDQLERSDRSGQALWWPQVAAGEPAPDCVVFIKETGRFAVMLPPGQYSVEDDDWYRHDSVGGKTQVSDLIEEAWQAAMQVRLAIKGELGIGAYTIPVIIFNDMEPNAGIMEAAQGRGVRVFFGQDEVVQRLVTLPDEEQLQPQLGSRYIQKEVAVLRPASAPKATTPEEASLEIDDGRLVIQHVDVVNVYINIHNPVAVLSRFSAPEARTPEEAFLEIGDGRLVIQHVDVVNVYITDGPDASGGASLPDVQG